MRQDLLKQFIEFDLDMVRILLFLFGLIFKQTEENGEFGL